MTYLTYIILDVILLVHITLIGGILPLVERKYLSLIQRRVGPKFVGYKGRLQFIADALKMFLKGVLIPRQVNSFLFYLPPILFLSLIYFLYINLYWGVNCTPFAIEFNLLFISLIGLLLNLCIYLTGIVSKNKYALISSIRTFTMIICCELLMVVFLLALILLNGAFSLSTFSTWQEEYPFLLVFVLNVNLLILLLLIDVNKSPFDLGEAETEIVTGFHTEYGAFFFALFYLGEYLHIFFSSAFFLIILTGL